MHSVKKGIPDVSSYNLAVEAHRALRGDANIEIPGVSEEVKKYTEATVNTIRILNSEGEAHMGRPQGNYITIEIPQTDEAAILIDELSGILAKHLAPLLPQVAVDVPFLVVGLGNHQATPDALGPKTVEYMQPTRHFFLHVRDSVDAGLHSLAAFAPGVMGMTGIETASIIRGVVEHVKPCCIIVIDALSAASVTRIGTTIQISDTGIRPGSGLENNRQSLNQATMGIPIIAIGAPTVVHSVAIISESFKLFGDEYPILTPKNQKDAIELFSKKLLSAFGGDLVVTPKEVDLLIPHMAKIIAAGITRAVHPGANEENYRLYMQ